MKPAMIALAGLLLALAACDDEPPPTTPLAQIEHSPRPASMRRLTADQYGAVVRDLLGTDIVLPGRLEPDSRAGGSPAMGATVTAVSARGVELYVDAAFDLAEQALAPERRMRLVACDPAVSACLRDTLSALGLRAWRRPLTDEEVTRLVAVSEQAGETLGDPWLGLQYGLAALLQSPHFIYRLEVPGGAQPAGSDVDGSTLGAYALASRLAFLLWNQAPDDALLAAAAEGRLATPEGRRLEAERMLADDRIRAGVRAFFADLYGLDRLDGLNKAPELFPHFDDTVAGAAREETLAVVERLVVDERGDYRDIMTTRHTVVDRKLASIYNVRAPSRDGFGPVELPADGPRQGLLGQVSTLALHSHPVSTSATLRGMFVRETLLCQTIPDPPSGVDTSIPEPSGTAPTLRDRIDEHLESPACRGCHLITDPIGLGLEHFDGLGRFRATDGGATIDPSGDLDGALFDGPIELGLAVREHPAFVPCLVERLYRYAIGREPGSGDSALLAALTERFVLGEHDVLELMLDIVESPAFAAAAPAEETPEEVQ